MGIWPAQRRAAASGGARRVGHGANVAGPMLGHRGSGLRQDEHVGTSCGSSDRQRRRSNPYPPFDIHAQGSRRDGAPGPAHHCLRHGDAQAGVYRVAWSGTFHAVGARLLRMFATSVGLDPAFTIHDREDSADLLNIVRHDLGLSEKAKRFPQKGTALAIYSRAINTDADFETVLKKQFPWCAEWEAELRDLFDAYVRRKQRTECARLRRSPRLLARDDAGARIWPPRSALSSTMCWWTNIRTPTLFRPLSCAG